MLSTSLLSLDSGQLLHLPHPRTNVQDRLSILVGEGPQVKVVLELLPPVGQAMRLIEQEQHNRQSEDPLLDIQEAGRKGREGIAQGNHGELQRLEKNRDEDRSKDDAMEAPHPTDQDNTNHPNRPLKLEMLRADHVQRADPERAGNPSHDT